MREECELEKLIMLTMPNYDIWLLPFQRLSLAHGHRQCEDRARVSK